MRALCIPALASVAVFVVIGGPAVDAQQATRSGEVISAAAPPIQTLSGTWDYNADESVNAATGRPEQAARSATQRGRGNAPRVNPTAPTGSNAPSGGGAGVPAGGASPYGGGGAGAGFGGGGRGGPGFSPMAAIETRSLTRDLLEVAEAFTIRVTDDAVTFVDDLERGLTFPTNGRKQKYQLGAAQFDARVRWTGAQLHKDIEGSFGFRMSETYFLSTDGQRLFVIVRLGEQKPGAPLVGFNRVYDRVPQGDARTFGVQ